MTAYRRIPLALALLAALCLGACRSADSSPTPPTASATGALPPAAGTEIVALLDGLKVGDSLSGTSVLAVGALDARGAIPIVIELAGKRTRLVVTAPTDHPPAPVQTKRYSIFYEPFDARGNVASEELQQAMNALAVRLRKTEAVVPTPAGLKPLPLPATPM